ncbi:ribbon-helix-helix domain-containing protein [Microcoleus sp. AT9b-C3]|uniref:ribbon-helix-helix domain-containing protein n=1 Tax=unclassified Microcoleus TaxID=2642155 RepID=UPI002FD77D52
MGVTKKAKITFTCEPNLKDGLEEWARSESRTLSNLIEMLIRQAYETHQESSSSTKYADRPDGPHPTENQPASATKPASRTKEAKN